MHYEEYKCKIAHPWLELPLLAAAFLYIYYFAIKMLYELQHEQMLQGLVGVVGCAKDSSHTSCIVKWWFEPR